MSQTGPKPPEQLDDLEQEINKLADDLLIHSTEIRLFNGSTNCNAKDPEAFCDHTCCSAHRSYKISGKQLDERAAQIAKRMGFESAYLSEFFWKKVGRPDLAKLFSDSNVLIKRLRHLLRAGLLAEEQQGNGSHLDSQD